MSQAMEWVPTMELSGIQLCFAMLQADGRKNIRVERDDLGMLRCTYDMPEMGCRSARYIGSSIDEDILKSMRYEIANKIGLAVKVPVLPAKEPQHD